MNPFFTTKEAVENVAGMGGLVLVVEDDVAVNRVTQERLIALRYAVASATEASEAIEILQAKSAISLVFSDIRMPGGMSGYDLAHWVHDNRPGLRVLLTTGYHAPATSDEVNHLQSRIKVLPKPYSNAALAAAISDVLNQPAADT